MNIIVTRLGVTALHWREPLLLSFDDGRMEPLPLKCVKVSLLPGESSSVRIGEREYVTVKRPLEIP